MVGLSTEDVRVLSEVLTEVRRVRQRQADDRSSARAPTSVSLAGISRVIDTALLSGSSVLSTGGAVNSAWDLDLTSVAVRPSSHFRFIHSPCDNPLLRVIIELVLAVACDWACEEYGTYAVISELDTARCIYVCKCRSKPHPRPGGFFPKRPIPKLPGQDEPGTVGGSDEGEGYDAEN